MLPRLLFQQQSPLRALCAPCRLNLLRKHQQRNYTVPQLVHESRFKDHGVPGLFTPEGFDTAWTQYQNYLINELNRRTTGTIYEHYTALELTKITGRNAQTAHLFNFASMAHNNHMFFRCLQGPTGADPEEIPSPVPMPLDIAETIKECFSSVDSFRETFLSTALGMFGPGFVWLMQKSEGDKKGSLTILCTYNAGSPYPEAHWRHQQRDMNITDGVGPGVSPQRFKQDYHSMFGNQHAQPQNMLPGFASHRPLAPGGVQIHPILCVSLWEHAWVPNFGIANKHDYLTAWWERIDWNEVFNLGVFQKDFNMGGFRNETTRARNTKYLEQMERRARITR